MENNNERKNQVRMHADFFDRCQFAIDNGFYFEAILMEYAAIEGRLEVILGVLGVPCNKEQPDDIRRSIKISSREKCLSKMVGNVDCFGKSKLDQRYFDKLEKWIQNRNQYIHGLYKNVEKYEARKKNAKKMAVEGLVLARKLYNEAKRLRRLNKKDSAVFNNENIRCYDHCDKLT